MTKLELQIELELLELLELQIEREAAACRAALKNAEVGDLVVHCHHERFLEVLNEPAENRISYILANKPKKEQPERLRRFRPIDPKKIPSDLKKARAEWDKACAEFVNAGTEWDKARAEFTSANKWSKAYAKWDKACAEFVNAGTEWDKANAELKKARDEWYKARFSPEALRFHAEVCGCPWGVGIDIFGEKR